MIPSHNLIEIGFVRAAHGLRGQVVVHAYSRQADSLTAYGALVNADGSKTFPLTVINAKDGDFLCKIKGIDDRNAAEALRGTKLFTPADRLPPPDEGEYYVRDLIGLNVKDRAGTLLGSVTDVMDVGARQALDIRFTHNGTTPLPEPQSELLLLTDANVPTVNIQDSYIVIDLPGGLLDTPDKN